MKRTVIPECLPAEIRELIALDLARENRYHSLDGPPHPVWPEEPAAGAPSPDGSPTTDPSTSNPNPASKETNTTGRESNGRFAKGNGGGPGNPFARQVAAFRACLINSVTEDDMKAIVYKLVDRARFGNLHAIKLLFSYLLGTPKPVVEPDELDLQEMDLAHQTTLAAELLKEAAPAKPVANDAPPPPDDEVGRPVESVPETSPPPAASAPSTNGANREPCVPTTGQAPSLSRESDVSEAGKLAEPPSTKRPNGEPAAGVNKNRPSTNGRPKRAREPNPVRGGSPGGQAADTDKKPT
jgi:hypothetical protein